MRWRVSWLIILGGIGLMATRGRAARHRFLGRHAGRSSGSSSRSLRRPSATRWPAFPGEKAVQRYGDSVRQRDDDPAAAVGGGRAGIRARAARERDRRKPAEGEHRQVRGAQRRGGRSRDRPGPPAQGHLRDAGLALRHHVLHRVPLPPELRHRSDDRQRPRRAHHAVDPDVRRLRAVAQRRSPPS